jgi:cation:H+ antiporter
VLLWVLLTVAGLVLLAGGGDQLVLGAGRVAERLGMAPAVIGVVLIGFGTSAPELVVSGLAARRGDVDLAIGNLVGSNILNLTFVLGAAGLAAPLVRSRVLRREVPLAVGAIVVFALLLPALNRWTGVLLAALLGVVMVLLLRLGPAAAAAADPVAVTGTGVPARPAWVEPARALLGLVAVLAGAELVVVNAVRIATRLGAPQAVIGFTLVAAGTSLPEFVTAIQAARRGAADLVVGNLFGSNLINGLGGGAVVGLVAGNRAGTATVGFAGLAAMVLTALLGWALLWRGSRLARTEAAVLIAAYALTLPLLLD